MVQRDDSQKPGLYINPMTDYGFKRIFGDESITAAFLSVEQQESYMRSLDNYRTAIAADRFSFEKGRAEGLEVGLEKGRSEGRAEGLEMANRANAKTMKDLGMDIRVIVQVTGLSAEEIQSL